MKVQIFVLRKDTADIIGNQLLIVRKLRESKPANIFFITSCLGKRQGEAAGPARIKPLARDNTREEKERVMMALRTG